MGPRWEVCGGWRWECLRDAVSLKRILLGDSCGGELLLLSWGVGVVWVDSCSARSTPSPLLGCVRLVFTWVASAEENVSRDGLVD